MIHGYMATFGAYGSWMPNDPRGSKSKFVGSRRLYDKGGKVTKNEGYRFEDLDNSQLLRLETLAQTLKRPAVEFTRPQIELIGQCVGWFSSDHGRTIWALAVLPKHIHLVFARSRVRSEQFVDELKTAIEERLTDAGQLPVGCDSKCSVWARGRWIDYLDSEQDIENAICYTKANAIEAGMAAQEWPFVTPFAGIESNIVSYPD